MNINQKGFANIVLVIMIVVILIGAVGYFAFVKKSEPIAPQSPTPTPTKTQKAISPTPTPDKNVSWKTYADSNLNYSFQYPPTTCELQRFAGDASFALCYLPKGSDGGAKHNNGYVITLGFISQSQLSVMGITYCDAYPNDSLRCESFKIDKVTASIDWGTGANGNASAWISHPNGGIVTFTLQPITAESKEILKQILSTFKFTN